MINQFTSGPFRNFFYDSERRILDVAWNETGFLVKALCLSWASQNFAHHPDFMDDDNPNIPNVFVDANGNPLTGSDMLTMWENSWTFDTEQDEIFHFCHTATMIQPLSEGGDQDVSVKTDANVTYSSLMNRWAADLVNPLLDNFNLNDRAIKSFGTTQTTASTATAPDNPMWSETPAASSMWSTDTNPSTQVRVTGGTAFIGDVTVHNNGTQQTVTVTPPKNTPPTPNPMWSETSTGSNSIGAKLRGIGSKLAANAVEVARHLVADDLT